MLAVLLAQLPVPNNPALNTPLAAGYLAAYAAAQGLDKQAHIHILPRVLSDFAGDAALVQAIVAHRPDVLGLSLYTWNSERSLHIAARVKIHLPNLCLIVGGPEVQADNHWVLSHPAVDIAVIGEGEQTFVAILRSLIAQRAESSSLGLQPSAFAIPGVAIRSPNGNIHFGPERSALNDLSVIPSPYLSGYLELPPDGMQMIEISRWCPYRCSFCLYGRNMGPKLGSRYFNLERVLAEIAWGKARGIRRIHFVEANLNLVPLFWPLMRGLADLNADRRITFYAELRGEHLTDEVVAALAAANVCVVEVGLQTANSRALAASLRRTDLQKWAAGTRRLYRYGIEVYLDVILGLPADDIAGVNETLEFIEREGLGAYDIFTLQVLPGTAVRQAAAQYQLRFQDRPPYYILATDRLNYSELRHLRRRLKQRIDLDPDAIEGMPEPRPAQAPGLISRIDLRRPLDNLDSLEAQLAAQIEIMVALNNLAAATPRLARWISANPSTIVDLYLICDSSDPVPAPAQLQAWRDTLPFAPGYLDRVAVYGAAAPDPAYRRVSPRIFLVLPWDKAAEPADYAGTAQILWRYHAIPAEPLALGAWRVAGGAGIWLEIEPGHPDAAAIQSSAAAWAAEHSRLLVVETKGNTA
ncbi:MAG: radical SAM protein [Oscillochloris sp.]|nr:radical SAM protein [Oscillochloris sp.]